MLGRNMRLAHKLPQPRRKGRSRRSALLDVLHINVRYIGAKRAPVGATFHAVTQVHSLVPKETRGNSGDLKHDVLVGVGEVEALHVLFV